MSSHASRWLIVIVLAPIVLAIIFLAHPLILALLVTLAGLVALNEFFQFGFASADRNLLVLGLTGLVLVMLGATFFGDAGQAVGLMAAVALGCLYFLARFGKAPDVFGPVARFALGQVYISFFLSFLIRLNSLEFGSRWVFFTLAVTFLADTGAFYVGRTLGKRPLYPAVSPKKTQEGLVGGMAASGIVAGLTAAFMLPVPWYEALIFGVFLGFWGAMGDLFESMLKRSVGIKDSGRILMGHGGVLDRIDALLFNLPLVYFFALMRVH